MLKYKIPQIVTLTPFFLYRLANYMLKYKIPQIVTLTRSFCAKNKNPLQMLCRGSL